MLREVTLTADGSHTVSVPDLGVTYHSHHGSLQESMHVFVEAGLLPMLSAVRPDETVRILEIGFGTGLNALVTLREAVQRTRKMQYISTEKYPLSASEVAVLNHGTLLNMQDRFLRLHEAPWEQETAITDHFSLLKLQCSLPAPIDILPVHCIYFDAFAPDVQPELWSQPFFEQLHQLLLPGGILTTYSSKGSVRRTLAAAGFRVEKIAGPRGKREMVRAHQQ